METIEDFKTLIRKTQMSHIYKQVMLQAVLQRGGEATIEQIASDIHARNTLQIRHYARRVVNQQPGKRLERDGALVRDGDTYRLAPAFQKLSTSDRLALVAECEHQIEDFVERLGDPFPGMNTDPVPGSLRYQVLKEAGGRCELCGGMEELHVDHVLPRAKGGGNKIENLQALCAVCNTNKRDTDDTDFRLVNASYDDRLPDCVFCQREADDDPLAFVIEDGFPVTNGHRLIIPRRDVADYFELRRAERLAIDRLLLETRENLRSQDSSITGFNVGINCGESAGQTVGHVHVHLIPRRNGDMVDPRGGVRRVIPEHQKYTP